MFIFAPRFRSLELQLSVMGGFFFSSTPTLEGVLLLVSGFGLFVFHVLLCPVFVFCVSCAVCCAIVL